MVLRSARVTSAMIFRFEKVVADKGVITLTFNNALWSSTYEYAMEAITNLRAEDPNSRAQKKAVARREFGVMSENPAGSVHFDCGDQSFAFGEALEVFEAKLVIQHLRENFPSLR